MTIRKYVSNRAETIFIPEHILPYNVFMLDYDNFTDTGQLYDIVIELDRTPDISAVIQLMYELLKVQVFVSYGKVHVDGYEICFDLAPHITDIDEVKAYILEVYSVAKSLA